MRSFLVFTGYKSFALLVSDELLQRAVSPSAAVLRFDADIVNDPKPMAFANERFTSIQMFASISVRL